MGKLFILIPFLLNAIQYDVHFLGLKNPLALDSITETSQLVYLQHRPPASINGLRYRINDDLPQIIKVLHAFAYYDASIATSIQRLGDERCRVFVTITPGPQFLLNSYEIKTKKEDPLSQIPGCSGITHNETRAMIGKPALSSQILDSEMEILESLSKCAHPLAELENRDVIVDMEKKTVSVNALVQEGPYTTFGETHLDGIGGMSPLFIRRRIAWEEGDPYDSDLVTKTERRLLNSELFSSVFVSHGKDLNPNGSLPLNLTLSEAKHKRLSLSAFFATVTGFGGSASWTDRNLRGMGESLSLKVEYSQKAYQGLITYNMPDFYSLSQTYKALAKVNHVNLRAYDSIRYRLANYIEKDLPPNGHFSTGLKVDHIKITNSASDGIYFLIGLPFFGKYERVENPINPKSGYAASYSLTPYQSINHGNVNFVKQRVTGSLYIPLIPNRRATLALLGQAGSIAGTRRTNIPITKLFLGGSENDLRGYRYNSVSPLRGTKPLGGRSAIYSSVELRFLLFDNIGIVPFADFGTVSGKEIPTFHGDWFKSVGLGLRYYAFFGPLRFDIGFPLDKRKGIDSSFQIYASVGQSF